MLAFIMLESSTITGNVTIADNFAEGSGGGIYNAKGAHADLTGATIQNNPSQSGANLSGGGGIYSDGGTAREWRGSTK